MGRGGGEQLTLTIFVLGVINSRTIIKHETPLPPPFWGGAKPTQTGQLALAR